MVDHKHRALRLSRGIPDGERVYSYLTSREARCTLVRAAVEGRAPLGDIAPELSRRFPGTFGTLRARQMAGLAVRAVLTEEGFVVDRPQVRLGPGTFSVAASFRRAPPPPPPGCDWVPRVVAAMTDEEAAYAAEILSGRLRPRSPAS